ASGSHGRKRSASVASSRMPARRLSLRRLLFVAAGFASLLPAVVARAEALREGLPPIIYVSRTVDARAVAAGDVPGLGPHGTFAAGRGRLMERSPAGSVREL